LDPYIVIRIILLCSQTSDIFFGYEGKAKGRWGKRHRHGKQSIKLLGLVSPVPVFLSFAIFRKNLPTVNPHPRPPAPLSPQKLTIIIIDRDFLGNKADYISRDDAPSQLLGAIFSFKIWLFQGCLNIYSQPEDEDACLIKLAELG
jgi:hypothetical protein